MTAPIPASVQGGHSRPNAGDEGWKGKPPSSPATTDVPLPFAELVEPTYAKGSTIQERFDAFHAANPWVADALETLAADWLEHGHQRVGVKALAEVVRWQYGRATRGSEWKVDNTLVSRYSRLLLDRHPEWSGAIETRALRAA